MKDEKQKNEFSSTETKPVLTAGMTACPVELSFDLFLNHLFSYRINSGQQRP